MASVITLIPSDTGVASLTLSSSSVGIWLDLGQESLFPTAALDETWAEGPETEGAKRTKYRPENPTGTGKVNIGGETQAEFRTNVALWQKTVNSVNINGGSLEYKPEGGETVTYEIRSMAITSLPQDGLQVRQGFGTSEFSITYGPYGSLPSISVFSNVETKLPISGFEVGDRAYEAVVKADFPTFYWRLGAGGATDSSGHGNTGTAAGGITIGGQAGALLNDTDGSTLFDGVDDQITSGYGTRINYAKDPRIETGTPWQLTKSTQVEDLGSGLSVFPDNPAETAYHLYGRKDAAAGNRSLAVITSAVGVPAFYIPVVAAEKWTLSADYYTADGTTGTFSETNNGIKLLAIFYKSSLGGSFASAEGKNVEDVVGTRQRISATVEVPAEAAYMRIEARYDFNTTSDLVDGYVSNVLAEKGSTVGVYFPTKGEQERGEVDLIGEEASAVGPYIPETTRTFEGWAYRTNTSAAHTLIGGSGTNGPSMGLSSGSENVYFSANTSSTLATWTAAWPGILRWVHWAFIFDDLANTVELFINGVSKGVVAHTVAYSSPGNVKVGAYAAGSNFFNGRLDEVAMYERRISPERIFAHYLTGISRMVIPGSAPAKVNLTLSDASAQARDHFEYGLDNHYSTTAPSPLLIDAPSGVSISEFAGSSATVSGAYSAIGATTNNVVTAALYNVAVALCSFTAAQIGKTRIKARLYSATASTIYVRLAWRIGEGEFTMNEWQTVDTSEAGNFCEADLGVVNAPTAEVGSQGFEAWIEAYSTGTGVSLSLDYLELLPLGAYGKATALPSTLISTAPVMHDEYTTETTGALTGKEAALGGKWEGVKLASSTTDFQVDATNHWVTLTGTTSDTPRRIEITATPTALEPVSVSWSHKHVYNLAHNGVVTGGIVARYKNSTNYVTAVLNKEIAEQIELRVIKVKAGVETIIAHTASSPIFSAYEQWRNYTFAIDATGTYALKMAGTTYLTGQDPDLETGGTLASGHVGIFGNAEALISGTTTLYFDNIVAFTSAPATHVINASKSVQLSSSSLEKEPTTGTVWSKETLDGGYPKLNPNRVSRIVVKARRKNVDLYPDANVEDKLKVSLTVTPRVQLVGA